MKVSQSEPWKQFSSTNTHGSNLYEHMVLTHMGTCYESGPDEIRGVTEKHCCKLKNTDTRIFLHVNIT